MSSISDFHRNLYRLYEHYVGEPDSRKDVYGYWLFILGYIVGSAGVFTFVVGYAVVDGSTTEDTLIRVAGVAAATGLALCLFGIGLMLPVRKRGIQASVVGLFISLAGVASYGALYPANWRERGMGMDAEVIAVYTTGIAIIAGVTALVPVVTGRKGMFVEEEGSSEDPAILTGDTAEGAQFAVFRDENGDWKWHVLHLTALAEGTDSAVTQPETREQIERVRSKISSAGLMELTTSAFRLYEDRDGSWQWTLARDDGSVVGACAREFDERDAAEKSVSFLKDRGPEADVIEIETAAFTYTEHRDRWRWRLVDDDRTPLASSESDYPSRDGAEEAARTFAERFDRARLLDIEHVGVELYEREDGWAWRLIDDGDDVVTTCTDEFDSRREAEEAVEALLSELESASITVAGEPTYEHYRSGEECRWRLVDENEHVIGRTPEGSSNRTDVELESERFSERALEADVVEIEDAEYEVYPAGETDGTNDSLPVTAARETGATGSGGDETAADDATDWHWRLVTEDRDIVAASTEAHANAEAASEAIRRVRDQASEADLIEFEEAAFQVYEADSGEWRWRLIDEDGNVLADSGEEHTSRGDAAEAMMTLKEQAPDAELLEIETAAFELFVNEHDEWGWRLIDEAGKLVAEDPATHPTRGAARQAMNRLLEHLESGVRTMERAVFQTYAAEEWHWRFVLPTGETVAIDDGSYSTRDELVESLGDVRTAADVAQGYTIGDVTVQLYDSGEWHWRLLDRDREEIADTDDSYPDQRGAQNAVRALTANVTDAPIFSIEEAAIRVDGGDDWSWELVDRDREVLAGAADPVDTREDVLSTIDDVRQLAPMAGTVDFDVASFELAATEEDRWRWRLIDEDGRTVASGSENYATRAAARDALADVRELIERASILEIDSVSFELHTAEGGWVWQLVDEYGSTMAESTRTYETRTDAREAMNDVKAHAPDGWITFTE
ncbi:YegP family protein [Natronococcus wangiae]|uniref:YegP family protein n=1 Tax=Natronococcus wangiae TaxID=3068275 RepID=UPI00273FDF0B|nr:YegP family protein [Natronococcus sp. AD5]